VRNHLVAFRSRHRYETVEVAISPPNIAIYVNSMRKYRCFPSI